MFTGPYAYLWLNVLTILMPFALSFDKKVHFYKEWKHLFIGVLITGTVFIVWDILFTQAGIWSFNNAYLTGWYISALPIEEWLFFITVPYACVFIYDCIKGYFTLNWPSKITNTIWGLLLAFFTVVASVFYQETYTFVTSLLCALTLLLHRYLFKLQHLPYLFVAYLISTIPFVVVNGVLTANPVVIYNNDENLGIRLFTIPIEDMAYSFLLLLMTVTFMEVSRQKVWNFAKQKKIATS